MDQCKGTTNKPGSKRYSYARCSLSAIDAGGFCRIHSPQAVIARDAKMLEDRRAKLRKAREAQALQGLRRNGINELVAATKELKARIVKAGTSLPGKPRTRDEVLAVLAVVESLPVGADLLRKFMDALDKVES